MSSRRRRKRSDSGSGAIDRKGRWWVLRFYERIPSTGEAIRRTKQLVLVDENHKTKASVESDAQVQAVIANILEPVNQREQARKADKDSVLTVGEFVERKYLEFVKKKKRASTYKGYRDIWENHLKSRCQDAWLMDVETKHVQAWLDDIAAPVKGAYGELRRLSMNSLKHIRNFLSGAFKWAGSQGYRKKGDANPVHDYIYPDDAPKRREQHAYTLTDIRSMLRVLPEPARTIVAVAGFAGLRRGEIRGLRWDDYAPATKSSMALLRVNRSVWTGEGYDRATQGATDPKTEKSKAPVPVIALLAQYIESYREQCGNPTTGWMFPNGNGKPHDLDGIYRHVLKGKFEQCGIEWHGWHGFRRGLGTNLYSLGVSDKVVQQILRHSDVRTTQDYYIKALPDDVLAGMRKLERAYRALPKQAAVAAA